MKSMRRLLISALVAGAVASPVHAELLSVSGPNSQLAGTAPSIIAAPVFALDGFAANTGMQGFDEAQGLLTTANHYVDGGSFIAAGTRVDSHMIFLNSAGPAAIVQLGVVWTFSGTILGVMSDTHGTLEAASTFELGNAGTTYGTFTFRGFEPTNEIGFPNPIDAYWINGNQLTVSMGVTEPGDWIRVVTISPIPEPEIYAMMAAGLGLLGFVGRRKRTSRKCPVA